MNTDPEQGPACTLQSLKFRINKDFMPVGKVSLAPFNPHTSTDESRRSLIENDVKLFSSIWQCEKLRKTGLFVDPFGSNSLGSWLL